MYQKVSTDMNFAQREEEVIKFWRDEDIFKKTVKLREGAPAFTFFDGPPTANGKPHIGHVETRAIKDIIPRYRTTYFNHIFNSGYSAGYYSYLWAEVLDKDAFEYFQQQGIYNPEVALKFRQTFLEKGGSEEPMTLYLSFRGAQPDPGALLRARGLTEK